MIAAVAVTLVMAAFVGPSRAAEPAELPAASTQVDALQRISISPFASYRVHEFGANNGKFGGGLAAGFALNPHLTLEAEVLAERFDDSHWIESLTEAGANFRIYPLNSKVLKPYALIGYTGSLDESQHRMNAGAGLEAVLSRNAALFGDGRWTHDFRDVGHALFRAGISLRF